MWFVNAGGERGPVNFQFPIQYGALHACADQLRAGLRHRVARAGHRATCRAAWPRVRMPIGSAQPLHGDRRRRISSAAIGCPTDLQRRSAVRRAGRPADPAREDRQDRRADAAAQCLSGIGVHPQHAIRCSGRSTSRPAPDGTIYIADMYHGIIQEAQWTPRGSYLRAKIEQYQLDKVIQPRPHLAPALRRRAGVPATPRQPRAARRVRRFRTRTDDAAAHVRARRRRSSSRTSRIRTAGGATRRSSCSC